MSIGRIIAEPLSEHRSGMSRQTIDTRVRAMMARVGLREQMINTAIRTSSRAGSISASALRGR